MRKQTKTTDLSKAKALTMKELREKSIDPFLRKAIKDAVFGYEERFNEYRRQLGFRKQKR